jgi:hypothetical protein
MTMTDQEMNIAIAQACGWHTFGLWNGNAKQVAAYPPDESRSKIIPNYCHDLNAMRSAVMAQEDATWRFQFQTGLEHRAKGLGKLVCELDAHDWAMEFCMKKALWT